MAKTIKANAMASVAPAPEVVAELSAQGLPDYLIAMGNVDTTAFVADTEVALNADDTKVLAPLNLAIRAKQVFGKTLDNFPRIGSKINDADLTHTGKSTNNFDLYEPTSDKKKRKSKAKKGREPQYRSRVRDLVERELSNGISLVAKIAELKKEQSTTIKDASKDDLKNRVSYLTKRLNSLVDKVSDGIKLLQTLEWIAGRTEIAVGIWSTATEPPPEAFKCQIPKGFGIGVAGEWIDVARKAPIKLYDCVVESGKPGLANQTSVDIGKLLRCNYSAVVGKLTVESLLKTADKEPKTPTGEDNAIEDVDGFATYVSEVAEFACGNNFKFSVEDVSKNAIAKRMQSKADDALDLLKDMYKLGQFIRVVFMDESLRERAVNSLMADAKANEDTKKQTTDKKETVAA